MSAAEVRDPLYMQHISRANLLTGGRKTSIVQPLAQLGSREDDLCPHFLRRVPLLLPQSDTWSLKDPRSRLP